MLLLLMVWEGPRRRSELMKGERRVCSLPVSLQDVDNGFSLGKDDAMPTICSIELLCNLRMPRRGSRGLQDDAYGR